LELIAGPPRAVQLLQEYTRLKRTSPQEGDLGWLFLLDSLIFTTEARVRWLDSCQARLEASRSEGATRTAVRSAAPDDVEQVRSRRPYSKPKVYLACTVATISA
jgi:hypothetical protein